MKIVVASGKGGTGKTTVAVSLAVAAARAGRAVHLCDCDVEEPNAHLFLDPDLEAPEPVTVPVPVIDQDACRHCGQCAELCAFNALACLPRQTMVFADLCHSCGGCWLVCPEQAIEQGERSLGSIARGHAGGVAFTTGELRVGETVVPPLIAAVKESAPADGLVILDSPPGVTCPAVETMRGADFAVLVTEPTPFGEHDLGLAADLAEGLGVPCGVIVNRAAEGQDRIERFCQRRGLPLLGRIPFGREIAAVLAVGGLALDADPQIATVMEGLLDRFELMEASR